MGRLYGIVLCFWLFLPQWGYSQNADCEQTIALATEEFNSGHFYSVPGILKECLNSFTREQKQRAFLLLTQTYLLLDDPIGAESSFLEILAANPEFVADPELHAIDIVYLSKRFTATPKFSWFVRGGSNVSPARVIRYNNVVGSAEDTKEKYTFLPGYNFGGGGEYSYNDNIRFSVELNYLQSAYKSETTNRWNLDSKIFRDRQSWLTLPLYVSYADNIGPYRPYVFAGYSFSKLFGDKASITLQRVTVQNTDGDGSEEEIPQVPILDIPLPSPDFDFKQRRNALNHSLVFGGGVKYKIGLDFVFAEVRYSAGLRNIVNTDQLYGNHTFDQTKGEWVLSTSSVVEYGHVDDYLRLDNISIAFGFIRPLYNPRELKRARTKGVLRRMKRSK